MTVDPQVVTGLLEGSTGVGSCCAIYQSGGFTFLATASHVEYSENSGPATGQYLVVNGVTYPVAAKIYNQVDDGTDSESLTIAATDWGCIAVAGAPLGSAWMGYAPGWSGGAGTTSGFPSGDFTTQSETFTPDPSGLPLLDFQNGLGPGSSGGPISYEANGVTICAGVNVEGDADNGASYGCQFTAADLQTMETWIAAISGCHPAIARLYAGILGNWPDEPSWKVWTTMYNQVYAALGGTLGPFQVLSQNLAAVGISAPFATIVDGFTGSQQFQNQSAGLSPTAFVGLLYQNVLGRAPDDQAAVWIADLTNGTITQDQCVLGFTESPEGIGHMGRFGQLS